MAEPRAASEATASGVREDPRAGGLGDPPGTRTRTETEPGNPGAIAGARASSWRERCPPGYRRDAVPPDDPARRGVAAAVAPARRGTSRRATTPSARGRTAPTRTPTRTRPPTRTRTRTRTRTPTAPTPTPTRRRPPATASPSPRPRSGRARSSTPPRRAPRDENAEDRPVETTRAPRAETTRRDPPRHNRPRVPAPPFAPPRAPSSPTPSRSPRSRDDTSRAPSRDSTTTPTTTPTRPRRSGGPDPELFFPPARRVHERAVKDTVTEAAASEKTDERAGSSVPRLVATPLPSPTVVVGYQRDWLRVASPALALWDKAPFEPLGGRTRDRRYVVAAPRALADAAAETVAETSAAYEILGLGSHARRRRRRRRRPRRGDVRAAVFEGETLDDAVDAAAKAIADRGSPRRRRGGGVLGDGLGPRGRDAGG